MNLDENLHTTALLSNTHCCNRQLRFYVLTAATCVTNMHHAGLGQHFGPCLERLGLPIRRTSVPYWPTCPYYALRLSACTPLLALVA